MRGVLLAGGGTAGHVNPLLAVAGELARRHPEARLLALGTAEGLEARLVPQAGLDLAVVPRVPLPRSVSADWARLPGRLRAAIAAASRAIEDADADAVVGFGGYVATPAYLAARRVRIPVVVHEGNFRPGLANRLGARNAARVAVTFPDTPLAGAVLTGMPLRASVATLNRRLARPAARRQLGLADRPTLLVTGGSLGAQRVNETMLAAAPAILAAGAQVVHLTGKGKAGEVEAALAGVPGAARYHALEYLDAMELAYAAADLVVCRAGAGTVCELAAVGLGAVYVPLPHGNGEQRDNARAVAGAGGGIIVDNAEFTPEWAIARLPALLSDPAGLERMGAAAASVGIRDGAARVVKLIEEACS